MAKMKAARAGQAKREKKYESKAAAKKPERRPLAKKAAKENANVGSGPKLTAEGQKRMAAKRKKR